jgi:hypothetical protein
MDSVNVTMAGQGWVIRSPPVITSYVRQASLALLATDS